MWLVAAAATLSPVADGATTVAIVFASFTATDRPDGRFSVVDDTGISVVGVVLMSEAGLVAELTDSSVRGSSDSRLSETPRWRTFAEWRIDDLPSRRRTFRVLDFADFMAVPSQGEKTCRRSLSVCL